MTREDVFSYVYALYAESCDGNLTVGDEDDKVTFFVSWDIQTAEILADKCFKLISVLDELSAQYDKLLTDTRRLTQEQKNIWDIFLRPFPDHGLDKEALRKVWEKETFYELLTEKEHTLSKKYRQWYEENALTRLPNGRCSPVDVINRAQRYSRLIQLNAPAVVRDGEAQRLIEEIVLYHCMV